MNKKRHFLLSAVLATTLAANAQVTIHGGAELFLYQTGYLTIKSSDEFGYFLGFPNQEVKQALYEVVLPTLKSAIDSSSVPF